METKSLTYEELGRALGITPASAKRLAIRRKWAKQPGNDGRTRVTVPVERLSEAQLPVTGDIPDHVTGDIAGDDPGDTAGVITVLERHVERLERELEIAKGALDTAQAERVVDQDRILMLTAQAAVVEPLRETMEALREAAKREQERADELRAERDDLLERARSAANEGLLARLRRALR